MAGEAAKHNIMYFWYFVVIFAFTASASYLAFFRWERATVVSVPTAFAGWAVLARYAADLEIYATDGSRIAIGQFWAQAIFVWLAFVAFVALLGVATGNYPTNSMEENDE